MTRLRRVIHGITAALLSLCGVIFGLIIAAGNAAPDVYRVSDKDSGEISLFSGAVTASRVAQNGSERVAAASGDLDSWEMRLLGVIPVKAVTVKTVSAPVVRLCGVPFGIKAYTDGVLVVGICGVDTHRGEVFPAKDAGIRVGDVILEVEGKTVFTNEAIAAAISGGNGRAQTFLVRRDGVEFPVTVRAEYAASEGAFKAGMWVRDSAAGIGTLTFTDEESGMLAGLGHAICDVDTGEPIPISGGELVPAYIFDVEKGEVGKAGELRGSFASGTLGELYKNADAGIYGKSKKNLAGEYVTVAMKQQVKEGAVKIYTCVRGNEPTWYEAEITKIRYNDASLTRNMVIKITDERLLAETGGIVQGMSGSPILQDGRLVGAITHVFLNDPTEGYGIFAETMWKTATAAAENAA